MPQEVIHSPKAVTDSYRFPQGKEYLCRNLNGECDEEVCWCGQESGKKKLWRNMSFEETQERTGTGSTREDELEDYLSQLWRELGFREKLEMMENYGLDFEWREDGEFWQKALQA